MDGVAEPGFPRIDSVNAQFEFLHLPTFTQSDTLTYTTDHDSKVRKKVNKTQADKQFVVWEGCVHKPVLVVVVQHKAQAQHEKMNQWSSKGSLIRS